MSIKAALRAWAAACAVWIIAGGVCCAAQASQAVPPPEAFAERPAVSLVSLSPDGRSLAAVRTSGGYSRLTVHDLESGSSRVIMESRFDERFGGVSYDWVAWKGNDRLLVSARLVQVERRDGAADGHITGWRLARAVFAAAVDGTAPVELQGPRSDHATPANVLDILPADPEHVLVTYRDRRGSLDVARVNVVTGAAETVLEGEPRALHYYTDQTGQVVGRRSAFGSRGRIQLIEARTSSGGWTRVAEIRASQLRDLQDFAFVGATQEPGRLYAVRRPEVGSAPDTLAVHIFDLSTRTAGPPLFQHDLFDVTGIVRNVDTGEFMAGCYRQDVIVCDFVDPDLNAHMRGLHQYFDGERSITVVSQDAAGRRWAIHVTGPDEPGTYYLYDLEERSVDVLADAHPALASWPLAPMRRVDYSARDGRRLHGYLTLPPGAEGSAPLVVMPHGGPEMRDGLNYDVWVQFLASRGYAVFQPNFRGSSGFGRGFAEAGYRQWGGLMQTDVDDGVQHLIDQGLAPAERVCIVGASYGGYAALQGGASRPDLYRCVISINGVSDLVEMMDWERSTYGDDSDQVEYWERSIGHPRRDRDRLTAASPISAVGSWAPPVLLIHGDHDRVVPPDQSRRFERALRRAGRDARLLILEREGHSGWSTTTEVQVMTEMEQFLAQHMPAGAEGVDAD